MGEILDSFGLQAGQPVVDLIDLAVLFGAAILVYFVARFALIAVLHRLVKTSSTRWDDELVHAGVFGRISYVAPALVVHYGLGFFPELPAVLTDGLRRVAVAVMILVGALAVSGVLAAAERIYDAHPQYRQRPIKSYLQLLSILLYLLAGLLIVAALMNE